ncbi:MAG: SAM-dependent methyltransferase [Acidimicrobiales bacterium]
MRLGADSFEQMYRAAEDPWGLATRWYEQRKHALTLAALPKPRYRRAFEPGCSVGVLTALLARRCGSLLSFDVAGTAVARARARTAELANVEIRQAAVPEEWPEGSFDLIVLSEVGYYLDASSMAELARLVGSSLDDGGTVVAVHWRPRVPEYLLDADTVHQLLREGSGLVTMSSVVDPLFRLEVMVGPDCPGPGPEDPPVPLLPSRDPFLE